MRKCTFEGCYRPLRAKGLCSGHYQQQHKGNSLTPIGSNYSKNHPDYRDPLIRRFFSRVSIDDDCWMWIGGTNSKGYGTLWHSEKLLLGHRISYELHVGPIPEGMYIDHKCWTPGCVNPKHLRVATPKQNNENLRGAQINSKSGIRGVYWEAKDRRWRVSVRHQGKAFHGTSHINIKDAEKEAMQIRNKLFTHNDRDRMTP